MLFVRPDLDSRAVWNLELQPDAAMKIAGLVRLATRHFLWNQGAIQRFRLTTENTESTEE
ncbi:MAG: hypothetical protein AUK47_11670 [Deltaproteobacteria bacterium CG2_30_63_29]|nr:MAG: hypothetical protein AUK47_11670 [Deltaproteobacteria bacterium CG2_30_63_29]